MGTTNDGYTHEEVEEQRERLTRADGTISIMEIIENNKKNPPKPKKRKTKAKETITFSDAIEKLNQKMNKKMSEGKNKMETTTPTIEKTENETVILNEKPIKQKRKDNWYEVTGEIDKVEFKNIVQILNRFYNLSPTKGHPTPAHIFREEIVITENKDLRIFLKQFGTYEFLIVVEISFQPKEKTNSSFEKETEIKENLFPEQRRKMDSWIHVDGISQERILMKEKGILKHPVFNITSLQDILLKELTIPVKNIPKPEAEIIAA
jgi:hypothetical protein